MVRSMVQENALEEFIDDYDNWRGVPEKFQAEWEKKFASDPYSWILESICPVCGTQSLKRYYHLDKHGESYFGKVKYIGRGSLWEWCSNCKSYEHMSVAIPAEWNYPIIIKPECIMHDPSAFLDIL